MIFASKEFYDQFSSHYHNYSIQRQCYLRKIDQLLLSTGKSASSLIDVGCGYGDRSLKLARSLNIGRVTLLDNSPCMLRYCNSQGHEKILLDISSNNFSVNKKFDMVLCLWNVLGHVETEEKRIVALKNMRNLLTENGKLYIDVNNRHNISEYGYFSVIRNLFKSYFLFYRETGDFLLKMKSGDAVLQTKVHIFTVYEMKRLIKESGLKMVQRKIINYQDGKEVRSVFQGQLFFILSKK